MDFRTLQVHQQFILSVEQQHYGEVLFKGRDMGKKNREEHNKKEKSIGIDKEV